jgi:hypothetical protein
MNEKNYVVVSAISILGMRCGCGESDVMVTILSFSSGAHGWIVRFYPFSYPDSHFLSWIVLTYVLSFW